MTLRLNLETNKLPLERESQVQNPEILATGKKVKGSE